MHAAAKGDQSLILGMSKEDSPKLPQPWFAKTAVIILPRILVAANSEEMTELKG